MLEPMKPSISFAQVLKSALKSMVEAVQEPLHLLSWDRADDLVQPPVSDLTLSGAVLAILAVIAPHQHSPIFAVFLAAVSTQVSWIDW